MRSYTQNKDGVGSNADSDLINRNLKRLEELQFYNSDTIWVEQKPRGVKFHAKPQQQAAASEQQFLVKDDLGSCLKCRSWDGKNEGGSDVFVAKPISLRQANVGDIQNGVTYAYTYSLGSPDSTSYSGDITDTTVGTGDGSGSPNIPGNDVSAIHYLVRTNTPTTGAVETHDITPPYLFNCIINAIACNSITLDTKPCVLVDTNKAARAWAMRNS